MQLAAKIRKDFLKVDRFWRTFLTNHSKYNPMPFDQLAPIESPAPLPVDNSYLKNHQIVPVNQIDVGVQTFELKNPNEKLHPNTNGFQFYEINGTMSDLSIESVEVYDSVKCEFTNDIHCDNESNDYPIDSNEEEMDEDSKDPTTRTDSEGVNVTYMRHRSGRKYPKNRNIHGMDPMQGEEKMFKCFDHGCKQGTNFEKFVSFLPNKFASTSTVQFITKE